jgi:S-adenosylmethionine:tRNA ribosyltransferase-isomerase
MKKSDFSFNLPEELIAQTPIDRRDHSRLMLIDKNSGELQHLHFYELTSLLKAGDCLVLNDSRVIPARLFGKRESGGAVEVVLLIDRGEKVWECLTRPGKKTEPGTKLIFGDGELSATVIDKAPGGNRLLRFDYEGIFLEILERLGKMPLPPYIKAELKDSERYQTVYSKEPGSAAAPTAGLHFTKDLLNELENRGVIIAYITLHVGLGTFRPVKAEEIEDHEMHAEYCIISEETAETINGARRNGGRIIACGTTSCRTLESRCGEDGQLSEYAGWTNIFIYPGYKFKCINGLITNFHLPESTLIMLVSALAGRENVLKAYEEAIAEQYRFFSFGDATIIL